MYLVLDFIKNKNLLKALFKIEPKLKLQIEGSTGLPDLFY